MYWSRFYVLCPQDGKSCCDDPSACGVLRTEPSVESNDSDPNFNAVEKQDEEEKEELVGDGEDADEQQNRTSSQEEDGEESDDSDEDMKWMNRTSWNLIYTVCVVSL